MLSSNNRREATFMELTVEMMKKLLDSAIINNEDVERAQIETIKEALMNKYGINYGKICYSRWT